ETEFVNSSIQYQNSHLKGSNRILDICKNEKAEKYFNPIGGLELYSSLEFKLHDIELNFLKSKTQSYQQFKNEFVPNLSIIDLLMFNSLEKLNEILEEFEIIK